MESLETIVVGAGVVGLAIARALAVSGREVVILESENMIGTGTSSRNSEVIHAGIYYEPGSLKARLCVEGRQRLYPYCEQRGVPHRRCGKLIVATAEADEQGLERIVHRAEAAGVRELRSVTGSEARAMEPALQCTSALLSPETGIIDSHGLMLAYLGEAQDHGATLAVRSKVAAVRNTAEGFELEVDVEGERMGITCRELVNAAGLGAVGLASMLEGFPLGHLPSLYLAKGNYFALTGRCPFSRLIYPLPNEAGLGVHLTIDLGGQGRFGPDVEWIEAIDYEVQATRGEGFYEQIRTYWPGLPDGSLHPSYSGIRPKLVPDGSPAADFRIDGPEHHGIHGLVNLFGIESPGLTASLAIADFVRAQLDEAR